jgi:predicted acylesterase/phospholipase RssA
METDLPMQRLSELFNINHFIVSQVNPHVLPFMKLHEDFKDRKLGKLIDLIGDEFRHRVMQLSSLGYFQGIAAVINQKYSGDVTIIPDFSLEDYTRLLSNPDKAWMQHCLNKSERKTWTSSWRCCVVPYPINR